MKGSIIIWIVVAIIILIVLFLAGISITEKAKKAYEKQKYELELFTRASILKSRPFDINRLLIPPDVAAKALADYYVCWVWDRYGIDSTFPIPAGVSTTHCPPINENYFYTTYGGNYSSLIKNCVKKSILEKEPCVVAEDIKVAERVVQSYYTVNYYLYNISFPKDVSVNEPLFYEKGGKKQLICNFNVSRFPNSTSNYNYEFANAPIYLWQNDSILFNNSEEYQPFIHGGYFPDDFKNKKEEINKIYVVPAFTRELYLTGGSTYTDLKHSFRIVIADAYVAEDETRDCMFNIYIFDQIEIGKNESDATVNLFNTIKNMPSDLFMKGEFVVTLDLGDGGYSCEEMFSAIDAGLWEWNRQNFYNKEIIKMMNNSYKLYEKDCPSNGGKADTAANIVFFDMRPWNYDAIDMWKVGPEYEKVQDLSCIGWKKAKVEIFVFDNIQRKGVECIEMKNKDGSSSEYGIRITPYIYLGKVS